jgi:hypothetical protein
MSEIIVEILEGILGQPRKHYKDKSQISFDCPVCSYDIKGLEKGDGKGNLEINYDSNVFKCWACSETNNTHGSVYKLVKQYGTKSDLKKYKLVTPELVENFKKEVEIKTLDGLPKEFIPLSVESFTEAYKKYADKYDVLTDLASHQIYSFKMQRTPIGGGYHIWHCEQGDRFSSGRILTFTCYLNDVVEGGETEFLYYPKRVPATQGTFLIFPGGFTHTHRGNPPLSNTKYIITGWVQF